MNARILIVDDDADIRRMLAATLAPLGHAIEAVDDGRAALDRCSADGRPPDLMLLDLMMPGVDGLEVLRRLRAAPRTRAMQVVVLTARAGREPLQAAFDAGADDFMCKPFDLGEVVARVKAQLRIAGDRTVLDRRRRDGEILLDISHQLTRHLDVQGILHDITAIVAEELAVDRCSVVLVGPDDTTGRVVAASDDIGLVDRSIDLAGYPEIRQVLATKDPVVADDIAADPLFAPVAENLAKLEVRSAALFPLREGDACIGVLFLRSARHGRGFGPREVQFGAIVANATAVAITNARLYSELEAESDRISHARAVVEQRLAAVQRYEDFFENSADAMLVTDPRGRLLFMNRQAERLVGRARKAAIGQPFVALLAAADHAAARALLDSARRGDYSRRIDLHPAEKARVISVAAARVPGEDAIGLTARDVTEERRLARTLEETRQQLAEKEKLSVIAEVAGAAAHELNQPLTSVMGYAELLERRLDGEDALSMKAVRTIQREADRMARIVRRIGRLTRYETRPYVGNARILDLQASAVSTGEWPAMPAQPPGSGGEHGEGGPSDGSGGSTGG